MTLAHVVSLLKRPRYALAGSIGIGLLLWYIARSFSCA